MNKIKNALLFTGKGIIITLTFLSVNGIIFFVESRLVDDVKVYLLTALISSLITALFCVGLLENER